MYEVLPLPKMPPLPVGGWAGTQTRPWAATTRVKMSGTSSRKGEGVCVASEGLPCVHSVSRVARGTVTPASSSAARRVLFSWVRLARRASSSAALVAKSADG
jgi:hypothetical protein